MKENDVLEVKHKIHSIRGNQVILDRDLASFYGIETRSLKQAVNRNKNRFPSDFMFILTKKEINILVSQNVIPSKRSLGGALPYAFTEQGVANLSSVLNSDKAIEINIAIMRAFVVMRKFIASNALVFERLGKIETKLIEHDNSLRTLFDAMQDTIPDKGIFFDGQIFDAYKFVCDLVKAAKKEIVLIDNYIDETVLEILNKRRKGVSLKIYTANYKKIDVDKFEKQYGCLFVKFMKSHDQFLIVDEDVYHFGASLKDLGKKWFAFSKFEKTAIKILERIK
ncbi:ORF6N domain-containing protein [Candidatus Woesearchaeota archaeon]|nr:ORF6N domain-containing protein [Candidatus Woesearchaeota archaeon]